MEEWRCKLGHSMEVVGRSRAASKVLGDGGEEVQAWALHRCGGEEQGGLQDALGGGGEEVQAGALHGGGGEEQGHLQGAHD